MLAVALCLGAGWLLWRGGAAMRQVPAARLVSPEALLFAECPDLGATALRWRETALCALLREPQMRAFLARPVGGFKKRMGWEDGGRRTMERIRPTQAFLAVTSLAGNMPRAVGGFAFAGERRALEEEIAKMRAQARAASPQGRLERIAYREFQIETFSDNGITVAGCLARNWYFVANDTDLLKATLDRFAGKTVATLATAEPYRASLAPLPSHPDFRLFMQSAAFSEKLLAAFAEEPVSPRKIRGIAVAARLEGSRLRDTVFLYEPDAPPRPVLNGKTLDLTTPGTLFYAAIAPRVPDPNDERQRGKEPGLPGNNALPTLRTALAAQAATIEQFRSAFGPEHALLLEWPAGAERPGLFLAMEVRDPGEARRFVESAFHAWSRDDAAGVPFWTLTMDDPAMAQFHPAVALTSRHLLAGLSPESLRPFAVSTLRPSGMGETLAQSPAFVGTMAALSKPQNGIAWLDARPLFERVYGLLRPLAMLWGNALPAFAGIADFSKLPTGDVIARHLSPIGLSVSQTETGLLMESTGTVTFLELGAGLGAAGFAIAAPTLRQKGPPQKGGLGLLPPAPAAPLSAPR